MTIRRAALLAFVAFGFGTVVGATWHELWIFPFPQIRAWMRADPPEFLERQAKYYVQDDLAGHLHRPNTLRETTWEEHPAGRIRLVTNNLGFREDSDTEEATGADTWRILVTGDSHIDGVVWNSESFPNRLEALLNQESSSGAFEVINGGVGYYEPHNYLGFLRKYESLRPDVYIVVVYTGNDFIGVLETAERKGRIRRRDRGLEYKRALKRAYASNGALVAQALNQAFLFREHPEFLPLSVDLAHRQMLEVHRLCQRDGIRLVTLFLPTDLDLSAAPDPDTVLVLEALLDMEWLDVGANRDAGRQLLQELQDSGVETLDLLPIFMDSGESLYWEADRHLSVAGHELIARTVLEYLGPDGGR